MDMTASKQQPAYIVHAHEGTQNAFVFAAPHSGRFYPADFEAKAALSAHALRQSEDAYVDELYDWVPEYGACLLSATYARAYLDLNRAKNEIDPSMFTPPLPHEGLDISHRVKAGLGLIPAIVAEGQYIYNAPLPAQEAQHRQETIHMPYHSKLRDLLDIRRKKFGNTYLIDCHSMPSETNSTTGRSRHTDIILGDSWGGSCGSDFISAAEELLCSAGFQVRRNIPYSGGYSTVHYGNPNGGYHALQIELNRALYMNEETHEKLNSFTDVKKALQQAVSTLIEQISPPNASNRLKNAAE